LKSNPLFTEVYNNSTELPNYFKEQFTYLGTPEQLEGQNDYVDTE
jgi:hypothetical protein